MNSAPLTPIEIQTTNDYTGPHQGVVLSFDLALRASKKHSPPCIFCNSTVQTQNFKGKVICSSCLQHIPDLFHHKRVQLV